MLLASYGKALPMASYGKADLAALSHADLGIILLVLGIAALAGAVWRAFERDVLGTILCVAVGVVLLRYA